jgi:hypothetical protein
MPEVLRRYPYSPSESYKARSNSRSIKAIQGATKSALQKTTRPLLEVGGPTKHGFYALGRKRLPNGIVISNFEPTEGASQIVDVRDIPYPPKSLGGIVMSALTRTPEEIAKAPKENPDIPSSLRPNLLDDLGNVMQIILSEKEGDYSPWVDNDIMGFSQRLAMLREARLKVEPHGVIIANTLSGGELRLAENLGFSMEATTVNEVTHAAHLYNYGEFLLVLNDLETPAGQYLETATI